MGDANPISTLGDYSKPIHKGYRNTIVLLVGNIVHDPSPHGRILLLVSLLNSFIGKDRTTSQQYPDVPTTSRRISFRSMDSFQGLTLKSPSSWHRSLAPRLVSNFMASQDARLSKFKADFKQQQSEMTNKIDTILKAITDRLAGGLPSDMIEDLGLFTLPYRLGDSKPFDTLADLGSCVNIIPLYLFKKLKIRVLEETDHIFGLADRTKSYPVGIVKDVEVCIEKLKLLNDFYVIDMKKDPKTPLLVGRGLLASANAVIDYRKAKIVVGERITRSVFGVKGVDLGEEEAPYWTTDNGRNLGALPINLKRNMWESEDLIDNLINWDNPPKDGDGACHAKIRIIDPDGEEFTKTL
ncbi:MAK10-like protein [Tanacetum coccineum]